MLIAAATRRASCRSSIEQQLPNDRSPLLLCDASYSCMDRPMTSWPCSTSSPAATDESTPPLIATTTRSRRWGGTRSRRSGGPRSRARSDPLGLMGQLGQLEEELGAGEVPPRIRLQLGRALHAD